MFDKLTDHHKTVADRPIRDLMDAQRARYFSAQFGDLLFDFSKTNIDSDGLDLLLELIDVCGLDEHREAMFTGAAINKTEGRAVLHTALRNLDGHAIEVGGEDIMPGVLSTLARMEEFATDLRRGTFTGQGGPITDVINIGIGGSDLGPAMAYLALGPYVDGPRCHFVSNVDPADISEATSACDPATTLVIVASKSFTTIETMANARAAITWMKEGGVKDPAAQLIALSSEPGRTAEWGIPDDRVFGFGDWVGGRYSVWGPIGLSLMLAIGPLRFREFLSGAQEMDHHFRHTPAAENLPILMALVGIWHNQICGYGSRAVLPYDNRLARLPAYLQQLEMESNGKGVRMDGRPVASSGPIVWGEPGTNGQHAFYQLIHQGPQIIPCEFLVAAKGHEPHLHEQHQILVANCLAQSQALMNGRDLDEARELIRGKYDGPELEVQAAHRVFPGNRPSITLAYPQLTPGMLGRLIALYEHRVFVEGAILGINSFDQWGVELGKVLARDLQPVVTGEAPLPGGSTGALAGFLRRQGL